MNQPQLRSADRIKLDRRILPIAFALGLAGDLLFRHGVPALSLALAVVLLIGAASHLNRTIGGERRVPDAWMLGAILCASAFALLDGFVLALDAIALGALIAAPTVVRYGAPRTLPLFAYIKAIGYTLGRTASGPFDLWSALLRAPRTSAEHEPNRTRAVVIGLGLAIPVLVVFGTLFAAADPAFRAIAGSLLDWDVASMVQDVVLITAGTVGAAGALRAWFDPEPLAPEVRPTAPDAPPPIDPLALSIAVGAMTLLFTIYVLLQFRYLFGGAEVVRSVTGLTVAEYARHGFFRVVQATALVVPILLLVDDLTRTAATVARRRLLVLSHAQFLLTLLVLLSAMARMWLYVDNFGLTQDRLLSSTILVWLALVLLWFRATVLAAHRERFAFGAVLAGFGCVAVLNGLVPDALIMRENVRNAISGKRPLDVRYAVLGTGADGIPYLIAHLHELPPATCVDVVHALEKRRNRAESVTGRSFNLARWRAATALRQLPAVAIASAAPLARSSSPGGTPPDAAGIGCPASN